MPSNIIIIDTKDERNLKVKKDTAGKFKAYAPHFAGPITAQESVDLMLKVFERSSIENGNGGTFVSQFGNKQWL